jgi:hypothetical protein
MFRTFCALGLVVLAAAACGGSSGSENFTGEDVVRILAAAPPLPEGSSWTANGTLEQGSFDEYRRAVAAARPGSEDTLAQLAQAGVERWFHRAWVSSGNSAIASATLFRDEAGADTGFDALQHLTPGWFFPQPVSDLGDEAVSSKAEPGAIYIWRRGNVVLFADMFRDRGSSFDYDAAARAFAGALDQRATVE